MLIGNYKNLLSFNHRMNTPYFCQLPRPLCAFLFYKVTAKFRGILRRPNRGGRLSFACCIFSRVYYCFTAYLRFVQPLFLARVRCVVNHQC